MKMNLALAQIATKLGDVESNLEKHLDYIKQAKSQKMDLLVFPELSLTGYVLQDLVATVAHEFEKLAVRDRCAIDREVLQEDPVLWLLIVPGKVFGVRRVDGAF